MSSSLAEVYMSVVVSMLRDMVEAGAYHAANPAGIGQQSAASSSTDPPEDFVVAVLKRYEPKIFRLTHSALESSASHVASLLDSATATTSNVAVEGGDWHYAIAQRIHVSRVVDILLGVRGALSHYLVYGGSNGGGTAGQSMAPSRPAAGSNGHPGLEWDQVRSDIYSLVHQFFNNNSSATTATYDAGGTTASTEKPVVAHLRTSSAPPGASPVRTPSSSHASSFGSLRLVDQASVRRCIALVDLIWLHSMFVVLQSTCEVRGNCRAGVPSSGASTFPSQLPSSPLVRGSSTTTTATTPQQTQAQQHQPPTGSPSKTPTTPGWTPSFVATDLALVPLAFFLRRQHITDIENLVCTWLLRDVDVYPTYRRLIQHWSLELFSIICCVDSSVAAPTTVVYQQHAVQRYAALFDASTLEGREGMKETSQVPLEPPPLFPSTTLWQAEERCLQMIAEESDVFQFGPGAATDGATRELFPVLLTPPYSFVEKYIKGFLSILGDMSVYKNYSGLLRYARMLSSWKIESNALLITLTSVLVELAAACKGKKELKAIFSEFSTRLLVPLAHKSHSHIDAWIFRNCEFLQMHHLAEWEGKAKYAPMAIPSLAACLGCCSLSFFVRQVVPFAHLVARSLPDADRRHRSTYLLALHHVLGVCFSQVLSHHKLSLDAAAASLRRDIFTVIQSDIASTLRRTPLTSHSTKVIEAATEIFLLLLQYYPLEGSTMLVDLLPADGGALHSEASAVALNVLSAASDAMFSAETTTEEEAPEAPSQKHRQARQRLEPTFRIAFQVWSSVDSKSVVPSRSASEDDVIGSAITTFPASPFLSMGKAHPLPFSGDQIRYDDDDLPSSPRVSYCYIGKDVFVNASAQPGVSFPGTNNSMAATGNGGDRPGSGLALFSEFPWDDEIDVVFRRIGGTWLRWGGGFVDEDSSVNRSRRLVALRQCKDVLRRREEQLVKRLSVVVVALKDLFVVPPAIRGSMRSATGVASAANAVFLSTLSDKERMSHRLLLAALLSARYWAPTSAYLAEIPRCLVHWNHSLVALTTSVIIPHFFLHSQFHKYGQVVVSRVAEAASLALDDRESIRVYAKALVDMARLLLKALVCMRGHDRRHHDDVFADCRSSSVMPPQTFEAASKWLLTVPTLPQQYYALPPMTPAVLAVDMQSAAALEVLDGVALVLLGNGDATVRLAAYAILSNVMGLAQRMRVWASEVAASDAASVDWARWVSVGESLHGTFGRQTIEEYQTQVAESQSVGCHWPDESKSFRLVSASSCYGRSSNTTLVGVDGSDAHKTTTKRPAATPTSLFQNGPAPSGMHRSAHGGTARLVYVSATDDPWLNAIPAPRDEADEHRTASSAFGSGSGGSGVADSSFVRFIADLTLPFVLLANVALDIVGRNVWSSPRSAAGLTPIAIAAPFAPGMSKSLIVAVKVCTLLCQQAASGNFPLDERYAVDAWRSAYALYYILLMVEAHPSRRVFPHAVVPQPAINGGRRAGRSTASTSVTAVSSTTAAAGVSAPPLSSLRSTHANSDVPIASANFGGGSSSDVLTSDSWLIPDKHKRIPELLNLTLGMLNKHSGTQDIFDVVTFLVGRIVPRAQEGLSTLVSLVPDFSRHHIEFVKKFMDDPVKSLARKDRRRALSYCAIATPSLLASAAAILLTTKSPAANHPIATNNNSRTAAANMQSSSAPYTMGGGGAVPLPPTPSSPLITDVQLQLVKLFDALDALVSVLITGNFSSTVAGSNAPTSSSSVTLTPQQHELLKTGGVSTLAALPPIPPAVFQTSQKRPRDGAFEWQQYKVDSSWPTSSITIDEHGGPRFEGVSWTSSSSSSSSSLSFEGSFSVRLRLGLVKLFGVFYDNDVVCSQFLRERRRQMEEFFFFNVIGVPTKNVVRALVDVQSVYDRCSFNGSTMDQIMGALSPFAYGTSHRSFAGAQSWDVPEHPGDPVHTYSIALQRVFGAFLGPILPLSSHQAVEEKARCSDGQLLLTRIIDNVLEAYVAALAVWSKVSVTITIPRDDGWASSGSSTATYPTPSCFLEASPFRRMLATIAKEATWAPQALRYLYNRLVDTTLGTPQHLFFCEVLFVFIKANTKLILADSGDPTQQAEGSSGNAGRPKVHGHQLFREESRVEGKSITTAIILESNRAHVMTVMALLLVGVSDGAINCTLRREAEDFLAFVFQAQDGRGHQTGSGGFIPRPSASFQASHALHAWCRILLGHRHNLYHAVRGRNKFNRLSDVCLYYLSSQRLVRVPSWLNVIFSLEAELLVATELTDESLKTLITVSRKYRQEVGDAMLYATWSSLDKSSPINKARTAMSILRHLDPDDQCFLLTYVARGPRDQSAASPPLTPATSFLATAVGGNCASDQAIFGFGVKDQRASTAADLAGPQSHSLVFTIFVHAFQQLLLLRASGDANGGATATPAPVVPQNRTTPASSGAVDDAGSVDTTFVLLRESMWDLRRSSARPKAKVSNAKSPSTAPTSSSASALGMQGDDVYSYWHFHEPTPSQAVAYNALLGRGETSTTGIGGRGVAVRYAHAAVFLGAVSNETEIVLLRPLRSVLRCLSIVSPAVIGNKKLLCDAAVELGVADKIPRSAYVLNLRQQPPRLNSTSACSPHTPPRVTPPQSAPRKAATFPASIVATNRPISRPVSLARAVYHSPGNSNMKFTSTDDDPDLVSIRSDASDATMIVHDDLDNVLPALLTSRASCGTAQDEVSLPTPTAANARMLGVDEDALQHELVKATADTLMVSLCNASTILLTVLSSAATITSAPAACVSCLLNNKATAHVVAATIALLRDVSLEHDAAANHLRNRHIAVVADGWCALPAAFRAPQPSAVSAADHVTQSTEMGVRINELEQLRRVLYTSFSCPTIRGPSTDPLRSLQLFLDGGFVSSGPAPQLHALLTLLERSMPHATSRMRLREETDHLKQLLEHLNAVDLAWSSHPPAKSSDDFGGNAGGESSAVAAGSSDVHVAVHSAMLRLPSVAVLLEALDQQRRGTATNVASLSSFATHTNEDNRRDEDLTTTFLVVPFLRMLLRVLSATATTLLRVPLGSEATSTWSSAGHCLDAALRGLVATALLTLPSSLTSDDPSSRCRLTATTAAALTERDALQLFWYAFSSCTYYGRACIVNSCRMLIALHRRGCLCSNTMRVMVPRVVKDALGGSSVLLKTLRHVGPESLFIVYSILHCSVIDDEKRTRNEEALPLSLWDLLVNVSRATPRVAPFFAALWAMLSPMQLRRAAAAAGVASTHASAVRHELHRSAPWDAAVMYIMSGGDPGEERHATSGNVRVSTEHVTHRFLQHAALVFDRQVSELFSAVRVRFDQTAAVASEDNGRQSSFAQDAGATGSQQHSIDISEAPAATTSDSVVEDFLDNLQLLLLMPLVWVYSIGSPDSSLGAADQGTAAMVTINEQSQSSALVALHCLMSTAQTASATLLLLLGTPTDKILDGIERHRRRCLVQQRCGVTQTNVGSALHQATWRGRSQETASGRLSDQRCLAITELSTLWNRVLYFIRTSSIDCRRRFNRESSAVSVDPQCNASGDAALAMLDILWHHPTLPAELMGIDPAPASPTKPWSPTDPFMAWPSTHEGPDDREDVVDSDNESAFSFAEDQTLRVTTTDDGVQPLRPMYYRGYAYVELPLATDEERDRMDRITTVLGAPPAENGRGLIALSTSPWKNEWWIASTSTLPSFELAANHRKEPITTVEMARSNLDTLGQDHDSAEGIEDEEGDTTTSLSDITNGNCSQPDMTSLSVRRHDETTMDHELDLGSSNSES